MKHTTANDENRPSNPREATVRLTRARAKSLGLSGELPPLHSSAIYDDKQFAQANLKRSGVTSAACTQHKKRAVLKDVTNITCEKLSKSGIDATRDQSSKVSLQQKEKVAPLCVSKIKGGRNETEEMIKVKVEAQKVTSPTTSLASEQADSINVKTLDAAVQIHVTDSCRFIRRAHSFSGDNFKHLLKQETLEDLGITNIDSHKDPLLCSLYAADIYYNLHTTEVDWRPKSDYMEQLQRDISQGMRGILIDWLVEVCEEYKLVPDTLYLTVNLIDRYLSRNQVEKQKLQLLGVTCMLIASKYEEICAPRVEELCYVTDNTYTKEEVVKMESRVLNFLDFRLSVPTTKKFLRRFIQAAQLSYKVPSVELEFLANYLAELTLIDYSFLKFLPSLIAASAVFLAKWTLDQSQNPWTPTLEYYTRYKPSDLECTVLKLQGLQLNTNGCKHLNAIGEKYKQSKFKRVSTLCSSISVESRFQA